MAGIEAKNNRWLTASELIAHLAQYPADMPVTATTADGEWWQNIIGASDPNETGESSIILTTRNDFDTRQW